MTLASYDMKTGHPVSGLLFENISLGLKRKLQKISKWLISEHVQLDADKKTASESEDPKKEIAELMDEEVKSDLDFASLEAIEAIKTDRNYDFEIIELIAK